MTCAMHTPPTSNRPVKSVLSDSQLTHSDALTNGREKACGCKGCGVELRPRRPARIRVLLRHRPLPRHPSRTPFRFKFQNPLAWGKTYYAASNMNLRREAKIFHFIQLTHVLRDHLNIARVYYKFVTCGRPSGFPAESQNCRRATFNNAGDTTGHRRNNDQNRKFLPSVARQCSHSLDRHGWPQLRVF